MFDGWRGRSEPLVVSERQVGAYRTENPVALQSIEPGVAVVTGGARGIGFAIARMLGSEGASVIVVDKDGDETPSARTAEGRRRRCPGRGRGPGRPGGGGVRQ